MSAEFDCSDWDLTSYTEGPEVSMQASFREANGLGEFASKVVMDGIANVTPNAQSKGDIGPGF